MAKNKKVQKRKKQRKEQENSPHKSGALKFKKLTHVCFCLAIVFVLFNLFLVYCLKNQQYLFNLGVVSLLLLAFSIGFFILYLNELLTEKDKKDCSVSGVPVLDILFLFSRMRENKNKVLDYLFWIMFILCIFVQLLLFFLKS